MTVTATSFACCSMTVAVVLALFACVPTDGVYVRDRRREQLREGSSEASDRRSSRGDSGQQLPVDHNSAESGVSTTRREPFQRLLVLCSHDDECERKSFCHGGEGHKSCLPCRRSRRRCQRNGMCCHGNVCRQGRCVPKEMRYDTSYAKTFPSESEEESISQHTRDNMRKLREDEACEATEQCADGLCCAQHFWTRICKPILVEGDVCTKKRDRHTDVFQRCHCGNSLSCKRHPAPEIRYHTCQFIKGGKRPANSEEETAEDAIVLSLVNEKEEPALRLEVQLVPAVQHEWRDLAQTHSQRTDEETVTDYGSENQSESENRWRDDEDGAVEEQRLDTAANQQPTTGRLHAASAHPVTSLIEVL